MVAIIGLEGLRRTVRKGRPVSSGDYSGKLVRGGRSEFYLIDELGESHPIVPDQGITISYRDYPRSFRVRLPANAQLSLF